ncbi:VOC family protein [Nocardioides gansuensis]|uniref:VOC family protein n=1 Tax=Nocardioides gansuensis TaxID=2138300 RepID=UPI001403B843|nr:VOC family protein [Nocardioides gansuensis]
MGLLYIREAVVGCADVDRAVRFHCEALGFAVVERDGEEILLAAADAPAGRLRLVPAAGSAATDSARVWDPGPRLFGLYSHDLEATAQAIEAAGGLALPRVSYPYGAATMTEMVGYGLDSVWWTIPRAVPGGHRPSAAYEAEPERLHSELHSAVIVVEDHDAAVAFFAAGGLDTVFDGQMAGADFERLVGMPTGAVLRLAFLSGPDHQPARFEIMSFTGVDATDRSQDPVGIQRLRFACDDVAATRDALLAAGAESLPDGALRGPAGVVLELVAEAAR